MSCRGDRRIILLLPTTTSRHEETNNWPLPASKREQIPIDKSFFSFGMRVRRGNNLRLASTATRMNDNIYFIATFISLTLFLVVVHQLGKFCPPHWVCKNPRSDGWEQIELQRSAEREKERNPFTGHWLWTLLRFIENQERNKSPFSYLRIKKYLEEFHRHFHSVKLDAVLSWIDR